MVRNRVLPEDKFPALDVSRASMRLHVECWTGSPTARKGSSVAIHARLDATPVQDSAEWTPAFRVSIERRRNSGGGFARMGTVKIAYCSRVYDARDSQAPTVVIGNVIGASWRDMIEAAAYLDVVAGLRELGRARYGYGPSAWAMVRPCTPAHPWQSPDEPNRHHTPFRYAGDLFVLEAEGAAAAVLRSSMVDTVAVDFHCSAFVVGPEAGGEYKIHHRRRMLEADPIDLDDWYARLVAGTGD